MNRRHKHCELIKAWAEGSEIQAQANGQWIDERNPLWFEKMEYRIKPRTVKREGWVNLYKCYRRSLPLTGDQVHSTQKEAIKLGDGCFATVKVEWEETV